jgi:hypothetical protein
MARSIGYQLAQHADHSGGMLCGLTEQEAEAVQSDPDAAVQLLVVRQLEGFAKAGKRVAPGEKKAQGGSGGSLGAPRSLFSRTSIRTPCEWSVLSASLRCV